MAPIGSASSPTWPSLRSSSPPSLPRPRCSRSRKTSVCRPLADSASPHLPTGGSLEERVKRLATLPLNFQPGTQCEYSPGTGFDTLGRVIEILSRLDPLNLVARVDRGLDPILAEHGDRDDVGRRLHVRRHDTRGRAAAACPRCRPRRGGCHPRTLLLCPLVAFMFGPAGWLLSQGVRTAYPVSSGSRAA